MNNGVILFAHNSKEVDYSLLAVIAAGLAKKNLNLPISLITDSSTIEWMKESKIYPMSEKIFDRIIETQKPREFNHRILRDGNQGKNVPFINQNRSSAWHLSPYDKTLLVDTDYLIFNDIFKNYWNLDNPFMISESIKLINGNLGISDKWISDTSSKLYWATTLMFDKSDESKIYFDMVDHVRENYRYYSDIYQYRHDVYRNDISFSISKHVCEGFKENLSNCLPPVLSVIDRDKLIDVKSDGRLIFLLNDELSSDKSFLASVIDQNIHVMNKQSIVRNKDKLLELL
jgi:hypothetical protein